MTEYERHADSPRRTKRGRHRGAQLSLFQELRGARTSGVARGATGRRRVRRSEHGSIE